MRKFLLLPLALLLAGPAAGQIDLTRAVIDALVGTRQTVSTYAATNLNGATAIVAATGAMQTWDFTSMTWALESTVAVDWRSDLSGVPKGDDPRFSTANLVAQQFETDDPSPTDTSIYVIQQITDDTLFVLGYTSVGTTGMMPDTLVATNDPDEVDLAFPATFGTMYEDSTDQTIELNGMPIFTSTFTATVEFDGWGTLILPNGEFDALRATRIDVENDGMVTDTFRVVEFFTDEYHFGAIEIDADGNALDAEYENYASAPLPVELTDLRARYKGGTVHLDWGTHSETNNAGFGVEHARPRADFSAVGFVSGQGTATTEERYTFEMGLTEPGTHRFRLRQLDYDGRSSYSAAVEVVVELAERFVLERAYPNPFSPTTTVPFAVAASQPVKLELFDLLGRRVALLYDNMAPSDQRIKVELDGSDLPAGVYVIRMEGSEMVKTQTVTLLR